MSEKEKRDHGRKVRAARRDQVSKQNERLKGNLFLVLEYLPHDLTGLLDMGVPLSPSIQKSLMMQLLTTLTFIHENGYVHRDLKCSNILVDNNYRIKLADFGLARFIGVGGGESWESDSALSRSYYSKSSSASSSGEGAKASFSAMNGIGIGIGMHEVADAATTATATAMATATATATAQDNSNNNRSNNNRSNNNNSNNNSSNPNPNPIPVPQEEELNNPPKPKKDFTNKVITLWYRPPELLLGVTSYTAKVDMWSAGCILGEIIGGRPLIPGKTELEQLDLVWELVGVPTERRWPGVNRLVRGCKLYNGGGGGEEENKGKGKGKGKGKNEKENEKGAGGEGEGGESNGGIDTFDTFDKFDNVSSNPSISIIPSASTYPPTGTLHARFPINSARNKSITRNMLDLLSKLLELDPNRRLR